MQNSEVAGAAGIGIVSGLNWSDYCLQWQEFLRWIQMTLVAFGVEPAACVQSILTILLQSEEEVSVSDGGLVGHGASKLMSTGCVSSQARDVREVALFERLKNDLSTDQLVQFTEEVIDRFYKLSGCVCHSGESDQKTPFSIDCNKYSENRHGQGLPPPACRHVEECHKLGFWTKLDYQPPSLNECMQRCCPETSAFTVITNHHNCEKQRLFNECNGNEIYGGGQCADKATQRSGQRLFSSDSEEELTAPKSQESSEDTSFYVVPQYDNTWLRVQEHNGNIVKKGAADVSAWAFTVPPSLFEDKAVKGDERRSVTGSSATFVDDTLCWWGGVNFQNYQLSNTTVGFHMPEDIFEFDPWDFINGNIDCYGPLFKFNYVKQGVYALIYFDLQFYDAL
ncbi:unnamed protein product [Soboliphyme baturini]|uniref:Apple domain-containing protein n=1 Tax=Soboliphyme baturini TaxID=241478 RepID=A0A183J161_9BILA|nr:unnamed protein product [Soboliphyme baturini]